MYVVVNSTLIIYQIKRGVNVRLLKKKKNWQDNNSVKLTIEWQRWGWVVNANDDQKWSVSYEIDRLKKLW